MNVPFLFITTGIAADNLIVANISGQGSAITKNHRWVFILLLFFIIQNQVVIYGIWFARIFQPFDNNLEFWLAVGILLSVSIKMFQELKMKNIQFSNPSFDPKIILGYALATSIYTFLLGYVSNLLLVGRRDLLKDFLPFVALFTLLGLLLGKYRCSEVLHLLNIIASCLIIIGTGLMVLHKIN